MDLKDFVKESLLNIVDGVKEAQEESKAKGAIISPRFVGAKGYTAQIGEKNCSIQFVDFEIVLGEIINKEAKDSIRGSLGVVLSKIGIGVEAKGDTKKEDRNSAQTSIRFSVPIILPSIDNGEITHPKVAHSSGVH